METMPRYMTRRGYDAIQAELDDLWTVKRPFVVQQVADAAALGDRSENAEYIYGKKRLREIDSRMRYLQRKVQDITVVDLDQQTQVNFVQFGAVVRIENEDGEERIVRLVDKDESEPKAGRISVQSPIGTALMGKREGDFVEVRVPKGLAEYEVLEIRYGDGEP
jgi:transcription elongation factor GreB